jgi:translation initiation factor IF-2
MIGVMDINKVRVHELSKELGVNNKELMTYLNQLGANVRNHMSTIEDKFVDQARQTFPVLQKSTRIQEPAQPLVVDIPLPKEEPKKQPVKANPVEKEVEKSVAPLIPHPVKPVVKNDSIPKSTEPQNKVVPFRPQENEGRKPEVKHEVRPEVKPDLKPKIMPKENKPFQPEVKPAIFNKPPQPHFTPAQSRPPAQPARGGDAKTGKGPEPFKGRPGTGPGPVRRDDHQKTNPRGNQPGNTGNRNVRDSRNDGRPGGNSNNRVQSRPQFIRNRGPIRDIKPAGPATNVKSIQLPSSMSVKDFSQLIEISAGDVIKKLIGLGVMVSINQEIDLDTMVLLAVEYKISATAAPTEEQKLQVEEIEDDPESLIHRSPVVTIMGHVDHGKTSLLDAIRETNVMAQEAGGITQHIGAYQVELNDRKITFLDTPGHAAFTAMRARGAQVTDIAILVVAADDGVMPQTVEAVNHAKDANVSIIVAINKIDKPGANPERIKQDLTEYGLVAEEWGGETIFVPVSAKQRTGIEALLEMILLVADVKDFKANPNRSAKGTIIEAQLDKGRGPVATVLVQNGTLQLGDSIIAGAAAGKVRALINDKGKRVKKAGPSMPVEVIGFNELPEAGDIMHAVTEDKTARDLADKRMIVKRESELKKNQKVTLDDLFTKIKEGAIKDLKIILKADVQGSVEAIRQSLERLTNDEVRVKVIHGGVGGIGEGDVMLASASNAIIIGFNVRPDPIGKRTAEKESVDIRLYRVIYNIIEDVQKAMEGMLTPLYQEVVNGRAEIRMVYKVPKAGNVAGCYVTEGKISRNNDIRLIRDNIVIFEGKIDSLKRFKDDAREVAEGFECGVGLERFNDIKEGDIIEAFSMEEIKRTASK